MDEFIQAIVTVLVLVTLSALSGFLKKRTEDPSEMEGPPVRRPEPGPRPPSLDRPQPPSKPWDWRDEIKRMLEEQTRPAGPPQPASPPPPLPAPRPQRPLVSAPAAEPKTGPTSVAAAAREAEKRFRARQENLARAVGADSEGPKGHVTDLHERLARLAKQFVSQKSRAAEPPGKPMQTLQIGRSRRPRNEEANRAVAMLQHSSGAQQAIIAALILGPPKSLESREL